MAFGEYLPDDYFRKEAMKGCVHNLWPSTMPGETTAFLARYLGVTRDEFALNIIKDMMRNPSEGIRKNA